MDRSNTSQCPLCIGGDGERTKACHIVNTAAPGGGAAPPSRGNKARLQTNIRLWTSEEGCEPAAWLVECSNFDINVQRCFLTFRKLYCTLQMGILTHCVFPYKIGTLSVIPSPTGDIPNIVNINWCISMSEVENTSEPGSWLGEHQRSAN